MKRWGAIGLSAALAVTAGAAVATWQAWPERCVDEVVAAEDITAPFRDEAPDQRVARLVEAADGWGIGTTIGSVGYDYNRFIDLAALPDRFAVWRKGDPVMAVVDAGDGTPQWGIRQADVRHTWDASAERFVMLAAPKDGPVEVASHDLASGERRWCARLEQDPLRATDPISTNVDTANNVLVLAGRPDALRLTSLAAADGSARWATAIDGIDRGDYVSSAWNDVVVVGGRPAHELADEPSGSRVLAGIDAATGEVRWRHEVGDDATATVVGDRDGQVVVREAGPDGQRLTMLDQESGEERWTRAALDPTADVVVRGGVVLIRTSARLAARDLGTGEDLWQTAIRQRPQAFPYGFRLAEQPMPDDRHLLLGATDALVKLRLSDGRQERWPLPTDGINTTWWPYRIALSGESLALATNTGAVLVGR